MDFLNEVRFINLPFFTARCYAERGVAMACRLSIRLSVRPSFSNVEVL